MKQLSKEEIKEIQLSILDSFAQVCEKHNLRYFLEYGTLLGCIRHKGFIPWDDDIDVSMPRADYNKLKVLFESDDNLFGEHIKLSFIGGKYDTYKAFLNVVDIRTITESTVRKKKYYYPIWIDIFPYDYTINDPKKQERFVKRTKLFYKLATYHIFEPPKKKNLIQKIKYLLVITTTHCFSRLLFRLMEYGFNHLKESPEITSCLTMDYKKNIEKSDYFDGVSYGVFEGKKYRIPPNYDDRLSRIYGNYMELPPEDQRIPHSFNMYWKD